MSTLYDLLSAKQRRDLDVLKPGETRKQKNWDACVLLGTKLAKQEREIRMQIAELAIQACFHKNGKPMGGEYNLNNYAKSIGINHNTLKEWVSVKKYIINKLPKNKQGESSNFYKTIRKVAGLKPSSEELNRIYDGFKAKGPDYMKYHEMIRRLKSIHHNSLDKVSLNWASEEQLVEIQHMCREIAFNIDKYFKAKKKKAS